MLPFFFELETRVFVRVEYHVGVTASRILDGIFGYSKERVVSDKIRDEYQNMTI